MVNIQDIGELEGTEEVSEETDLLFDIFERQRALMIKYHQIEKKNGHRVPRSVPANLHDRHDQQYIKDFAWRITEEVGEAMNCLKNKPWKQTEMQTDVEHFIEELIDGFHFYVELLILIGLDPKTLHSFYVDKSRVNAFRQRSNY